MKMLGDIEVFQPKGVRGELMNERASLPRLFSQSESCADGSCLCSLVSGRSDDREHFGVGLVLRRKSLVSRQKRTPPL